jgi:hypothetical protein
MSTLGQTEHLGISSGDNYDFTLKEFKVNDVSSDLSIRDETSGKRDSISNYGFFSITIDSVDISNNTLISIILNVGDASGHLENNLTQIGDYIIYTDWDFWSSTNISYYHYFFEYFYSDLNATDFNENYKVQIEEDKVTFTINSIFEDKRDYEFQNINPTKATIDTTAIYDKTTGVLIEYNTKTKITILGKDSNYIYSISKKSFSDYFEKYRFFIIFAILVIIIIFRNRIISIFRHFKQENDQDSLELS